VVALSVVAVYLNMTSLETSISTEAGSEEVRNPLCRRRLHGYTVCLTRARTHEMSDVKNNLKGWKSVPVLGRREGLAFRKTFL